MRSVEVEQRLQPGLSAAVTGKDPARALPDLYPRLAVYEIQIEFFHFCFFGASIPSRLLLFFEWKRNEAGQLNFVS